jgi:hypothetical protein
MCYRAPFRDDRVCEYCLAAFVATLADMVFCSARCGRAARGCDPQGRRLARGAA